MVYRRFLALPTGRARRNYVDMGKRKYGKPQLDTHARGGIVRVRNRPGRRPKEIRDALIVPQAQTIIEKFGGVPNLVRALNAVRPQGYNPSSVYRWNYPVNKKGTGGEIPTRALKDVVRAARMEGILLTSEDLYPHLVHPTVEPDEGEAPV